MSRKILVAGLTLAAIPVAAIASMVLADPRSEAQVEAKVAARISATMDALAREADPPAPNPLAAATLMKESAKDAAFKAAPRMPGSIHTILATHVRDGARDPSSFSVVEAREVPGDTQTLCLTYQATNSYNSIVTEQIAVTSAGDRVPWAEACTDKRGWDVTYFLRAVV